MCSLDTSKRYFDILMGGPDTCGLGVGLYYVVQLVVAMADHVLYASVV